MMHLEHVDYETGGKKILHDVSFSVNQGEKVGIIGPNGVGKTTLLKLINGDLASSSGKIIRTDEEVGLLPQTMFDWFDHSVYEFIEEVTGVKDAREQFDVQCASLEHGAGERTLQQYADALERYGKFEVAMFDTNLKKALECAGMPTIDTSKIVGSFSGGQRTRIALAALFASRYDVILLDEPTNNLDEKGVVMLEEFMQNSPSAFLVVSHDRRFLRHVATRIVEMTGTDQSIKQYGLGYDEYIEARERAKQAAYNRYERYESEKRRLEHAAKTVRLKANSAKVRRPYSDNNKLAAHFRKEKAANAMASAARSMDSRLEQLEIPEQPEEDIALRFLVSGDIDKKRNLLSVSDIMIKYENGRSIGPVSFLIRSTDKLLLTGENGAGKTSIIRGIVGKIPISSGNVRINQGASMIYIDQDQTLPLPNRSALDNIRHLAPSIKLHDAINLLVRFNFKKDMLQITLGKDLSGGERAKLLIAGIVASNVGLLILDEPTSNLDIPTIEALERALKNYRGGVLLVSHDRDFVQNIGITRRVNVHSR